MGTSSLWLAGAMMLRRASIGLSVILGVNSGVSSAMCASLSEVLVWTVAIGLLWTTTRPQRSTTKCIAMKEVTIARPAKLLSEHFHGPLDYEGRPQWPRISGSDPTVGI